MTLRCLVVQGFAGLGGSEAWLLRLLDATDALDVEVLLLQEGPLEDALRSRGVPVRVRPVGASPAAVAVAAVELGRALRLARPDVVLGNTLKAQLVAAPAGLAAGVPTVWAKHDHSYDRTLARPVGRMSTRVVAAVEELGDAVRRPDVTIVPPPRPDRPPAPRDEARAHLAARGLELDERPVVAVVGRLVPFKGVDDAVTALSLPAAAGWRLAVLGTDDPASPHESARLRSLAERLGVADRVHFAGHVPDAGRWLAAFDALAVLTRRGARREPAREGFGTSAFEAMLAGVPVVAVEGGAVVRRLEGRAGIGVPPASPAAVAAALGALREPTARARAGAAGREIVAGHPDAVTCAALLVGVLEDAVRSRR